jgi:integrase
VYHLLHSDFTKDPTRSVVNAWAKHVLAHHFGFGLRSPKEYWFMRVDAYNQDAGILKVIEPKKRLKERLLFVEPTWLATARSRPSLDRWLEWRDKLNPEGRAMYPNPETGRDFPNPDAFRMYLNRLVQPRFPWFHGYLARHWCTYARIIDAGFTDSSYNAVAEWFGHEKADMTRDVYAPGARAYSKSPKYGKNWLSRAFQKPRTPTNHG